MGLSLAYVSWAQARGDEASSFVPVTMLITAALFAIASLPTFFFLRERATPQPHLAGRGIVGEGFARLGQTIKRARRYRDLRRFLVCTVFSRPASMP